jgi:Zn finger protein HypA/HybF involved in hydrogenase expression
MSDFGDRSSQAYSETIEDIDCPICKKAKVRVSFVAGYMTWNVSRIAAGSERTPYLHDPKVRPQSACPSCKATRQEIKDAFGEWA